MVVTFLNKLLGGSEETDIFWNQLSRQSQEDYQCYVDRREINVGYFAQAIQKQCRVRLLNVIERKEDFFRIPEPLNLSNFSSFAIESKTYDLSFTEFYCSVSQHLK